MAALAQGASDCRSRTPNAAIFELRQEVEKRDCQTRRNRQTGKRLLRFGGRSMSQEQRRTALVQPPASRTSDKRSRCDFETSPRAMEPPWATKTDNKTTANLFVIRMKS